MTKKTAAVWSYHFRNKIWLEWIRPLNPVPLILRVKEVHLMTRVHTSPMEKCHFRGIGKSGHAEGSDYRF